MNPVHKAYLDAFEKKCRDAKVDPAVLTKLAAGLVPESPQLPNPYRSSVNPPPTANGADVNIPEPYGWRRGGAAGWAGPALSTATMGLGIPGVGIAGSAGLVGGMGIGAMGKGLWRAGYQAVTGMNGKSDPGKPMTMDPSGKITPATDPKGMGWGWGWRSAMNDYNHIDLGVGTKLRNMTDANSQFWGRFLRGPEGQAAYMKQLEQQQQPQKPVVGNIPGWQALHAAGGQPAANPAVPAAPQGRHVDGRNPWNF